MGSFENKTRKYNTYIFVLARALTLYMKRAAKAYFRSSWKLVSICFPFQGRRAPCHPPGRDTMLTQERGTSRAGLWAHQQQRNPRMWLGRGNKITPSAYARLSANSALCLYDAAFSKASCRLLTGPQRVSLAPSHSVKEAALLRLGTGWPEVRVTLLTLLLQVEYRKKKDPNPK